jgi:hypothetical protein
MENLVNLLEENLERVDNNLWAEWLDDNHKEVSSVKGMLKALNLNHLKDELLEAERKGLVKLGVDDQSLLVELL